MPPAGAVSRPTPSPGCAAQPRSCLLCPHSHSYTSHSQSLLLCGIGTIRAAARGNLWGALCSTPEHSPSSGMYVQLATLWLAVPHDLARLLSASLYSRAASRQALRLAYTCAYTKYPYRRERACCREIGVRAIYSGHDHDNDYVGKMHGVRLAYG